MRESVTSATKAIEHGLGLPADDPATTWPAMTFGISSERHEDTSGNFPQLALFGLASVVMLVRLRFTAKVTGGFWLCVLAAAALFALTLRWQPWHARLHLPVFLGMAAFSATAVPLWRVPLLAPILAGLLCWNAVPFVIANPARPLAGERNALGMDRNAQYFLQNAGRFEPFKGAVKTLVQRNLTDIGLQSEVDDVQYPLWPLYASMSDRQATFRQVNVTNSSASLQVIPPPEAVVVTHPIKAQQLSVGRAQYQRIWQQEDVAVFQRLP